MLQGLAGDPPAIPNAGATKMTVLRRTAPVVLLVLALPAQEPRPTPASGRIEGRVVDAMGKPAPRAEVWLANAAGPRQRTDGDGMFVFSRVPNGYQSVRATADGCCVVSAVTRVAPDTPFHFATLGLLPGAKIAVRVRDDKGEPIAGAHVLPSRTASPGYFFTEQGDRFETDAEGRVAIDHVALGDTSVNAWAPGFGLGTSRCHVSDGTEVEVTLRRTNALQLQIELTGATPEQIRAATWRMYASRDGTSAGCGLPLPLARGTLDADGTRVITGLPLDAELRDVAITLPGAVVEPNPVNFEPADKTLALEQTVKFSVLPARAQKVTGTVAGPDGRPLAGLPLTCRSFPDGSQRDVETRTDANGAFAFADVAADGTEFQLTSLDPRWVFDQPKDDDEHDAIRYRRRFVAKIQGDMEVGVQCIPATELRGRVVDAEGRGVGGASVKLQTSWQKTRTLSAAWTTSDRDGMFVLPRLNAADEREVWIEATSRQGGGRGAPFRMEVGAAIRMPDLTLRPPGAVTGVVRNAAGKPVAGASIRLMTDDGQEGETISGRDGRFLLPGLAPGAYRFYCRLGQKDDAKDPVQVVVPEGETVVVSPVRG
jgi:hypothetical protein